MAEKAYWAYRLKTDALWQREPYVFQETAYFALKDAALILQQQSEDLERWEPVHHGQVDLKRLELPMNWCVAHDQGSCVVMGKHGRPWGDDGQKILVPEARQLIGQEVRTFCGYRVEDVETVKLALPRCDLCIKKLFKLYVDQETVFAVQEEVKRQANAIMNETGAAVFWIPDEAEVVLIQVTERAERSRKVVGVRFPPEEKNFPRWRRDSAVPTCLAIVHPKDWEERTELEWPARFDWKRAVLILLKRRIAKVTKRRRTARRT